MTAAIPPAGCAGADDGEFFSKLDRLCHADRGSAGVFPARAIQCGLRADGANVVFDLDIHLDFNFHFDLDIHFNVDLTKIVG